MAASWLGTKMASGRENYPMLPTPVGPLHSAVAHPHGPLSGDWLQMFLSTRSLDLAAMDTKLVAVDWNSRFSNLIWVQRPWQEIKHLVWVSHVLVMLFGTPFICHQWGSLSDVGMPPTWEKGSYLPPGNTKLGNLRDGHDSVTAPIAKPDLGFSSSMLGECWSVEPIQGCQKCDRVWHRYTRWTGRLSHQTSDLSHPHNSLPKGSDRCFAWYWVQGDAGSDLPD